MESIPALDWILPRITGDSMDGWCFSSTWKNVQYWTGWESRRRALPQIREQAKTRASKQTSSQGAENKEMRWARLWASWVFGRDLEEWWQQPWMPLLISPYILGRFQVACYSAGLDFRYNRYDLVFQSHCSDLVLPSSHTVVGPHSSPLTSSGLVFLFSSFSNSQFSSMSYVQWTAQGNKNIFRNTLFMLMR